MLVGPNAFYGFAAFELHQFSVCGSFDCEFRKPVVSEVVGVDVQYSFKPFFDVVPELVCYGCGGLGFSCFVGGGSGVVVLVVIE